MANELYRLLKIFRETLDDEEIAFEADSQEPIEGWDSLAHVQLMLAVEDEFGVTLTTDEMAKMTSVPAILEVVARKDVAS